MNQLGFIEPIDSLCQGVVVAVVTSRPKLGLSSRAMWREIARGVGAQKK
jgi:hypothetical protein